MRSPTLSRVLLAAVAALGLGDSADAAQLVTDPSEFSMPFAVGRMPVVADVPLFDPALGTLNRVTLTVHMGVNDPAAILTNTDPVNPTFVFDDRFDFLIRGPGVFDPDNPS